MAKLIPILLILSISSLLLSSATTDHEDTDEIAFLESEEQNSPSFTPYEDSINPDFENYDDLDDSDFPDNDEQYDSQLPTFDEKDVTVLTAKNFSEVVGANKYVMVEFYAPWCGHCQALAPEYAAAASELKGEAVLAKVDATEETELAQRFDVQGFPTVVFFVDGAKMVYQGGRDKDAIITWVKKKTGPSVYNVTASKEAEQILNSESRLVLAFLDSLVGPESEELDAASKLEDDVKFYQTTSREIAELFHIEPQVKRPSLVLLKKESEKLNIFDGQFSKQRIAEFVSANKIPLVITLSRETAPLIFENPIKKQLLLFAPSTDSEKLVPTFKEVAKLFKGKLVFVYVQMDEEENGKAVSEYFGIQGDAPKLLAYTGNEDDRKYLLDAEITFSNIKSFADDFLEDKLKPFYKSDPVPERNDGDVKIVVGNNFDEIVLDESKDVLLEIYAPWCGHCQALEPTYNKLGKYLRGIDSLVIAKMDGSGNEHPRAKPDGFPTILFFPAGNKSFDPITFDSDRTVVEFYKFLKKHASIPFKLQISALKRSKSDASESQEIDNGSVKDEL